MGQYKRKLSFGLRWYFRGQYKGKKYCSNCEFLTKPEARQEEAKYLKELEKEIKNPRDKMTLLELCSKRLDYIKASKSKSYYKDNKIAFSKLLKKTGDIPVEKVKRPVIHEHLLSESQRLNKEGKDNYQVNYDLKMIRALFNYGINELDVLDHNPTKKLKPYPVDKNLKYIPPQKDLSLVYSMADEEEQLLILFVKESACRISEALRATGDDIDLEMNLLTLWTRKKKYSNLVPRRIPLPPALREFKKDGRLFPRWKERPRFLDKLCGKAGIKKYGWHAYRHLKASLMANQKVPIMEIKNYLGHESLEVTQTYLHLLGYLYH